MFGFFKRNEKKPDLIGSLLDLTSETLEVQLVLCTNGRSRSSQDVWSLGYIFGFHDGILQAAKIDDQSKALAIMAVSYDRIFGGVGVAAPILKRSLSLQTDKTFCNGVRAGGAEAFAFVSKQIPPLALAKHIDQMNTPNGA